MTSPLTTDALRKILLQQVEMGRVDLVGRYRQSLQETLFTGRTTMRPSVLGSIATEEVEALLGFLGQPSFSGQEHGDKLCQLGLSEQTVLRLGRVTRQFLITHLEKDQIAPALELIDAHQEAVILGFIQSREKTILSEQEQIRGALQTAVGRYTVEIKEVQDLAQQATEANQFKTRFIARISHELRTPLGALMGMAEMLEQNLYGPLTPAQQDIIQRIINNARLLNQIFSELLDESQIELGQLRLHEEAFSPQALIQTVHSNLMPQALQKKLTLHAKINPDLPPMVLGDRARIEQIVSNLVVNAIKFTPTGGVTIQTRKNGDTHWMVQVKDTGIGISPEDQAYIFEPFRQVDETTGRKFGGVGLGLAIVQHLVTAMNGTVSLESKLGQGSTFTVTLPLQEF